MFGKKEEIPNTSTATPERLKFHDVNDMKNNYVMGSTTDKR